MGIVVARVALVILDHQAGGWCIWIHLLSSLLTFLLLLLWPSVFQWLPALSAKPLFGLCLVLIAASGRVYTERNLIGNGEALDLCLVTILAVLGGLKAVVAASTRRKTTSIRQRPQRSRRRRWRGHTGQEGEEEGDMLRDPLLVGEDEDEEEQEDDIGAATTGAPLDKANTFSRLGFRWVNPLLSTGFQRQLQYEDIPGLPRGDSTALWARRFQRALAAERGRAKEGEAGKAGVVEIKNNKGGTAAPSLLHAAHMTFGAEFYYFAGLQVCFYGGVWIVVMKAFDHQGL